jgi:catechol 2,3-dioxygenase-like lactoylglutathione lyase family enzyme
MASAPADERTAVASEQLQQDGLAIQLAGFSHVALTVSDIAKSRRFYSETLGLTLMDSSDSYCALLVGAGGPAALILTSHADGVTDPFSELRPGLDHVSLAVSDVPALAEWQSRLEERGVPCDLRRSEWGHHLNFRDPDNIAIELLVLEPDQEVEQVLARAGLR